MSFSFGFILSIPVGILTGIIGTSGGIMFIFIIIVLFSMKAQDMVGTATLPMLLSALSGTAGYIIIGHIDYMAAIIIGVVALISGYYFSILAHKLDQKYISISWNCLYYGDDRRNVKNISMTVWTFPCLNNMELNNHIFFLNRIYTLDFYLF